MRDFRKLTASVLTAALILNVLPFTVFADEVPETEPDVTSETEYVDADNEGLEAEIDEAAEVADAAEEETVLENAEEITAEEIVAEETATEEFTSEEVTSEEAPAEEITAEEAPAEEIAAEAESVDEFGVEDLPAIPEMSPVSAGFTLYSMPLGSPEDEEITTFYLTFDYSGYAELRNSSHTEGELKNKLISSYSSCEEDVFTIDYDSVGLYFVNNNDYWSVGAGNNSYSETKDYVVHLNLSLASGFAVPEDTSDIKIFVNNQYTNARVCESEGDTLILVLDLPYLDSEIIDIVSVTTGKPGEGYPVTDYAYCFTENCTISSCEWSSGSGALNVDDVFENDIYTVTVKLTADNGYVFKNDLSGEYCGSASIGGQAATASFDNGVLTLTYTFGEISTINTVSLSIDASSYFRTANSFEPNYTDYFETNVQTVFRSNTTTSDTSYSVVNDMCYLKHEFMGTYMSATNTSIMSIRNYVYEIRLNPKAGFTFKYDCALIKLYINGGYVSPLDVKLVSDGSIIFIVALRKASSSTSGELVPTATEPLDFSYTLADSFFDSYTVNNTFLDVQDALGDTLRSGESDKYGTYQGNAGVGYFYDRSTGTVEFHNGTDYLPAGVDYFLFVAIESRDGSLFPTDIKNIRFFINGFQCEIIESLSSYDEDRNLWDICIDFTDVEAPSEVIPIEEINILHFAEPAYDHECETSLDPFYMDNRYNVESLEWSGENSGILSKGDRFYDDTYTITIKIKAISGYEFSKDSSGNYAGSAKIGDKIAQVSLDGDILTLTYTYEKITVPTVMTDIYLTLDDSYYPTYYLGANCIDANFAYANAFDVDNEYSDMYYIDHGNTDLCKLQDTYLYSLNAEAVPLTADMDLYMSVCICSSDGYLFSKDISDITVYINGEKCDLYTDRCWYNEYWDLWRIAINVEDPGTEPPTPTPTPSPDPDPTPAPTGVEGFVDRCYSVILGRNPEEAGMQNWVNALNNGTNCGAQVAYGFIFSQEYINKNKSNTEFVTDLYLMFFGRNPDSAGLNNWLNQLNAKVMTREQVFAWFAKSAEYKNICSDYGILQGCYIPGYSTASQTQVNLFVYRLYSTCFGRNADIGGLENWSRNILAGNTSGYSAALGFFTSTEYKNLNKSDEEFIKDLYSVMMDRNADSAGLANWVKQLTVYSREEVIKMFCKSQEYRNICARYGINVGV